MSIPNLPYFRGQRADLVALEREDMPLLAQWINDERINIYNGARFPVSDAEQRAWYERLLEDRSKKKLIIQSKQGEKVGLVSLFNIDHTNQNAEIGVYIAPDHQRGGYASEALRMVIRFAFNEMNLQKVYCTILGFNTSAVRLVESVGFRPDGVRARHVFAGGTFVDVLNLAIFREDLE